MPHTVSPIKQAGFRQAESHWHEEQFFAENVQRGVRFRILVRPVIASPVGRRYGRCHAWPAPLLPILMTLAGLASFSVMDGTMKAAALALGAFAAIFWRSTVGALAIAPLWLRETVTQRGGRLPPRPALRVHVLRGVVSAAMAILFFDGVVRMPLAQGMALSFIAPLIALYLAAFTLGERLSQRAVFGSLLALVGVGVIAADQLGATPGPQAWRGLLEILTSAVLYAITLVLQRRQAQMATPVEVAFTKAW
jgi:S-adenosylmethionine uptake transporter